MHFLCFGLFRGLAWLKRGLRPSFLRIPRGGPQRSKSCFSMLFQAVRTSFLPVRP